MQKVRSVTLDGVNITINVDVTMTMEEFGNTMALDKAAIMQLAVNKE